MGGGWCTMRRNACGILVGKPEGKRSLGRPRRWLEDIIEKDRKYRQCNLHVCTVHQ